MWMGQSFLVRQGKARQALLLHVCLHRASTDGHFKCGLRVSATWHCREAGCDPKVQLAQLAKAQRTKLLQMLTSYRIQYTGHEGFAKVSTSLQPILALPWRSSCSVILGGRCAGLVECDAGLLLVSSCAGVRCITSCQDLAA